MTNLQYAFQTARKVQESLYDGRCSIYEYKAVKDEKTKLTKPAGEVLVAENIPCRLSYSSIPAAQENTVTVGVQQTTKLFLAPEVKVMPGSKLVITQNGVEKAYKNSGEPAIYSSHQEINLELFASWA